MTQIIPFNNFPYKKLNIKAYCRRSWGKYYQEKVEREDFVIENAIDKPKFSLFSWLKNIFTTTLAEKYGIKATYLIIFLSIFYIALITVGWFLNLEPNTSIKEKMAHFAILPVAIILLWLSIWWKLNLITFFLGGSAWWFNPFSCYQLFFYHKIVSEMNQLYAAQWELCLCSLWGNIERRHWSFKKKFYITHYAYLHNNKVKKLPIYHIPEKNNDYWQVDDCVLCVRSPNKQIPLPLDKQLNCIRGLNANEKEILRQKIMQAVKNYQINIQAA